MSSSLKRRSSVDAPSKRMNRKRKMSITWVVCRVSLSLTHSHLWHFSWNVPWRMISALDVMECHRIGSQSVLRSVIYCDLTTHKMKASEMSENYFDYSPGSCYKWSILFRNAMLSLVRKQRQEEKKMATKIVGNNIAQAITFDVETRAKYKIKQQQQNQVNRRGK